MKEWRAGKDVKNKDGDSRSEQDVLQVTTNPVHQIVPY